MATKKAARPPVRPAKQREPEDDSETTLPAETPGVEWEETPSFSQSVNAWLEVNRVSLEEISAYLYRLDATGKRWLINKFSESIPDPDQIGRTYGPGRYALHIQAPGHRSTTAKMNIGDEYGNLPGQSAANQGIPGSPVTVHVPPQADPMIAMRGSFHMMREMIEMFKPLLDTTKHAAPQNDLSAMMTSTMDVMGEMMKKSMRNTMELVSDIQRERIGVARLSGPGAAADEQMPQPPQQDTPAWLDKFMPLIERFLPTLLGNGPGATVTAELIRSTAEYQELVSDRNRLAHVVNALESSFGPAKVRAALSRLGIIEQAAGEQEPEPAPEEEPQFTSAG